MDRAVEGLAALDASIKDVGESMEEVAASGGWMTLFRQRWVLMIFAGLLLAIVILFGDLD